MLHMRIVSPPHRTEEILGMLRSGAGTTNITFLPGAALDPIGDVVMCDIVREAANDVVAALRALGIHREGALALARLDISISDAATEAAARSPGYGSDAAVWDEVETHADEESTLTFSFLVFIVIAALIAAVGLVEDAPILIVGAMVVGPEFGPIAGLSVGVFGRNLGRVRTALTTLAVGLGTGTAATYLATETAEALGLVPSEFSPSVQPLTGFIVDPSVLSFVVALLAGVAGTLSLTQARAGALIGVLISVTTIPAVAAIGVAAALGRWEDARGATIQLGLNLLALVIAGVLTLWTQRTAWDRLVSPNTSARPPTGRGRDG